MRTRVLHRYFGQQRAALFLVIATAIFVSSCIPGKYQLRILRSEKPDAAKEVLASSPPSSAKFKLSFFNIPSLIRKNDCYETTVGATNEAGVLLKNIATEVTISASSGVVVYNNLKACQTYNAAFEQKVYSISSSSPQATFYFRSDAEGGISLSAEGSAGADLTAAAQSSNVSAISFDGASGFNQDVKSSAVDSNGKLYVGGSFNTFGNAFVGPVACLKASDGTIDESFKAVGTGLNEAVYSLATQSDGKVIVAGDFDSYNGTSAPRVARINTDGSLDTSFLQAGTGLNSSVFSVGIQSDGKLVAAGYFDSYNGTTRTRIARLNLDGSLDTSFVQVGAGINNSIDVIALQNDNKAVVAGFFSNYNGTSRIAIARLNTNGSLDTSFAPVGTSFNSRVRSIQIQSDGKILTGGWFNQYNGTSRSRVARLNSNGSLDTSFALTGTGFDGSVESIYLQSDGKILVGGSITNYNGTTTNGIARLNSDGSFDTSFLRSGPGTSDIVQTITRQLDGKIVFGGTFTSFDDNPRQRIARLNADGVLDATFANSGSGANNYIHDVKTQADGKIIIGGNFSNYNGSSIPILARLKSDGSLDENFKKVGTGFSAGSVYSITTTDSDKFFVGGSFSDYNGTSTPSIGRFNSDGSLDTSFSQSGSGISGTVMSILMQPDEKIIAGGYFLSYNGTARNRVARLNQDGSLDPSFSQTGTGIDNPIFALGLQSDGKIIVGGMFSDYNGTSMGRIARLNQNGSLDTSFLSSGTGFDFDVRALKIQSDGKILVGGYFSSFNGTTTPNLARLNTDGSLDPSFTYTGTGFNDGVTDLVIDASGSILVGGAFTNYNGTTASRVARLNQDGSLNKNFVLDSTGFNQNVNALWFQNDNKILVGGDFTRFGQKTLNYFVRLTYIGTLD